MKACLPHDNQRACTLLSQRTYAAHAAYGYVIVGYIAARTIIVHGHAAALHSVVVLFAPVSYGSHVMIVELVTLMMLMLIALYGQ